MRMFMWTIWLVSPAWISHTPTKARKHGLTSSGKDSIFSETLPFYHRNVHVCMWLHSCTSFWLITAPWRQAANSVNTDTRANRCREALLVSDNHFTIYKIHVSSICWSASQQRPSVKGLVKNLIELKADQPVGGSTWESEAVLSVFRSCPSGGLLVTTDIES